MFRARGVVKFSDVYLKKFAYLHSPTVETSKLTSDNSTDLTLINPRLLG
jgi:hypothetical protein